jgi:hypothetical protein
MKCPQCEFENRPQAKFCTEGFDTADLKAAKALLEQLA